MNLRKKKTGYQIKTSIELFKKASIAIIPARGGSKRIPKKNIKDFLGKPIIAYSIETAIQSNLFDEIMISTDDSEIAEIAIKYGAKVPFLRSYETANDYAVLADVVVEVLKQYQNQNIEFNYVCCILATAPFLTSENILAGYQKLIENDFDAVFPVVKYSSPVQRAFQFDGKKIKMAWPENLKKRSQDLAPFYYDPGLFYWIKADIVLNEKSLLTNNTTAVILNEKSTQDIDTPEDWEIAELKYRLMYGS